VVLYLHDSPTLREDEKGTITLLMLFVCAAKLITNSIFFFQDENLGGETVDWHHYLAFTVIFFSQHYAHQDKITQQLCQRKKLLVEQVIN